MTKPTNEEKLVDKYCELLLIEQELKNLITMHDTLKKSDDFYYASYMKDCFVMVKRKLRKINEKNS